MVYTYNGILVRLKNTSQSQRKSTLNIHWKDWCWSSNTSATWCKQRPIGKDPDAGKDWGQEEKRVTKDEMVGWHHQLNALEFEQTRRQWRTGKPGILQLMGPQRVRHDLVRDWIRIRTRKEILTHVITWMNLEGIVLREVRQSWKNIYMYMLWIRRYV